MHQVENGRRGLTWGPQQSWFLKPSVLVARRSRCSRQHAGSQRPAMTVDWPSLRLEVSLSCLQVCLLPLPRWWAQPQGCRIEKRRSDSMYFPLTLWMVVLDAAKAWLRLTLPEPTLSTSWVVLFFVCWYSLALLVLKPSFAGPFLQSWTLIQPQAICRGLCPRK